MPNMHNGSNHLPNQVVNMDEDKSAAIPPPSQQHDDGADVASLPIPSQVPRSSIPSSQSHNEQEVSVIATDIPIIHAAPDTVAAAAAAVIPMTTITAVPRDDSNTTNGGMPSSIPSSDSLNNLSALRPTRHQSHQEPPRGKLIEPTLIDVLPTSDDKPKYDQAFWSTKTPEECLALLADPQSGVGFADARHWNAVQINRAVDLIETKHTAVITRKGYGARYGWGNAPGVDISFKNVCYTKNGIKRLQNISGYFRAGSMVAVIGAPDAGVSTFFDVLCGRDQRGHVTGDILVNGRPRDKSFNRLVSYVMKDDVHLPLLTVRETLTFSAKLRVEDKNKSDQALRVRVDMNIKLLGLKGCANTIIGDGTIRGVSGGERRRVTIGCELVSGTPAVVMDLPTNGLDSATAYDIVNGMKQQSLGGRTFVCSLAQPSPELLRLFDTIMILSKGACIYFGPRREIVPYLTNAGFHCPIGKPVPEFLEELSAAPHLFHGTSPQAILAAVPPTPNEVKDGAPTAAVTPSDGTETRLQPTLAAAAAPTPKGDELTTPRGITMEAAWTMLVQGYQKSPTYANVIAEVDREVNNPKAKTMTPANNYEYNTNLFTQAKLCCQRQFTELFRNRAGMNAMFVSQVILGLMLGSLFWQLGHSQADARTRFGLIFFCLTFTSSVASQLIPPYLLLRPVFYVQKHGGYMRGLAYYMGRFMVNVPVGAAETLCFSLIVYSMCGLQGYVVSGEHYWYFWMMLYTMNLTAKGFAFTIASLSKTQAVAMGIAPIFFVLFTMFAGFMVPYSSIPPGWQWIYWLSFVSYAIKGLMVNELMSLTWTCNPSETLAPGLVSTCQFSDGHSALKLYDMDVGEESYKWTLLGYVVIVGVIWNFFAIITLVNLDHSNFDTAEMPNWDESTVGNKKKKKAAVVHEDDHNIDPALLAALKPEPAFISWENLSYIVDIPKNTIGAAAARKDAKERAKAESIARQTIGGGDGHHAPQVEMVEVKKPAIVDNEPYTADAPLKRTLLQDCYGYAKPGMMVALMGGSGAGKTTLLDVLAGKKTGGTIVNGPLINGKPRDLSFNRIAGYVEQFDSHDETATVREAITFSAMLRLPAEMSYEMKMNKVDTVIQTLRLSHVQNQQIGNVVRGGISPELRKKVTIAVELVMDPGMLFLDEPTTGLDSAGALAVMHAVRKLSDKISVICTIHQPSIEIVNCFTHVLLLNKWRERGRVAYFGPLKGMAPYFSQAGLGEFEDGENLAEFGLESLKQAERRGVNAAKLFLDAPQGQSITNDLKTGIMTKQDTSTPGRTYSLYAANFFRQVYELSIRFFFNNLRDKPTLNGRFFISILISLLVGTLYWQSALNQLGAQNRVSLMYLSSAFPAMSAMSKLPTMILARQVYFREKNSSMYSPFAYYAGRVLGDQPFVILETLFYCSVLYWIAGMRGDYYGSHFGIFMFTFWMVRQIGISFVELFGGLAPTGEAAVSIVQSSFTMFQLFSGFLIRRTSIPAGWIWMHYLSLFKYPIGVLVSNELSGLSFSCPNNDGAISLPFTNTTNIVSILAKSPNIYCTGVNGTHTPCYACPITVGDDMLRAFDMPVEANDRHLFLACVAIFLIGYRFLAFLSLRFKNHINK